VIANQSAHFIDVTGITNLFTDITRATHLKGFPGVSSFDYHYALAQEVQTFIIELRTTRFISS
jgi:hypothetical protein